MQSCFRRWKAAGQQQSKGWILHSHHWYFVYNTPLSNGYDPVITTILLPVFTLNWTHNIYIYSHFHSTVWAKQIICSRSICIFPLLCCIVERAKAHTYVTVWCVLVGICIVAHHHDQDNNKTSRWFTDGAARRWNGSSTFGQMNKAICSGCCVGCVFTANKPLWGSNGIEPRPPLLGNCTVLHKHRGRRNVTFSTLGGVTRLVP